MKKNKSLIILTVLIGLLAAIASGLGAFSRGGEAPADFTSLHGQVVQLYGQGLYRLESVSTAAQAIAQDYVTLFLGLPLLVVSLWQYLRDGLRGKLLLAGTLGYFLYTYISMTFAANYNSLFLLYVWLSTLSLFAFIFTIQEIDLKQLPFAFSSRLPRRGIAILMFCMALFVSMLHLSRIIPTLLSGTVPEVLEHYTTYIIAALDLGLIAPTTILAGILLLRRQPWGYLLAAVLVIKGVTLATAVTAMMINQALAGVSIAPQEMSIALLTVVTVYFAVRLLANIRSEPRLSEINW